MTTDCGFSFDDLHLLGVKSGHVFIKGWVKDDSEDCVLAIKKRDFNKMFKLWIKEKENFCKRYEYFCGVGGIFYCDGEHIYDTEILDTKAELDIDDPNWKKSAYKPVSAYRVVSFSEQIDMEHG